MLEALRVKVHVKGDKFYVPAVRQRGLTRPLHGLFDKATSAQEYADRFVREWKRLHTEKGDE